MQFHLFNLFSFLSFNLSSILLSFFFYVFNFLIFLTSNFLSYSPMPSFIFFLCSPLNHRPFSSLLFLSYLFTFLTFLSSIFVSFSPICFTCLFPFLSLTHRLLYSYYYFLLFHLSSLSFLPSPFLSLSSSSLHHVTPLSQPQYLLL